MIVVFLFVWTLIQWPVDSNRTSFVKRNERLTLIQQYLVQKEGAVRLVGGKTSHEGNVEIIHHGKWGAICDDEWDEADGKVVCRQLGYPGYKMVTHNAAFGLAKRKFLLDNLYCIGSETKISDCRFEEWGENDCEPSEAAGVICQIKTSESVSERSSKNIPNSKTFIKGSMDVRLKGGRTRTEGQVEVRLRNGNWGTLCPHRWTLLEANVVCRELNYGFARNAIQTDFFGGANQSNIILSGTECYGNEFTLRSCLFHDSEYMNCYNANNNVAAVFCTNDLPDLIFDHVELQQSVHLEDKAMFYLQCAMEENCVANEAYEIQKQNEAWHLEMRRLLKFTVRVMNIGKIDFRPSIPKHLWEWHMCHMHYHSMEVFATYDIYDFNGTKVAQGHKASFCLEDNQCLIGIEPKYNCANYGDQGISVNCSDIYRYNIDCQWVDITDMDFGEYRLKISVNPEFKVAEMSYNNNAAACKLIYTQQYARIYDCRTERP